MFLKFVSVKCVLVLPALIRVHNQTLHRRKTFKSFIQHILDLFHVWTGREIVRNNLICVHIQDRRNVTFAPSQIELRYIRCPLLQRLLSAEISIDNIVSNFADIALVRMVPFFGTFAKQSKLIHDSLDTLVIYLKTTVHEFMVYSPYAVPFLILIEDANNFRR